MSLAFRADMIQREVQDGEGTRWTCVQALSGLDAEAAAEKLENDAGEVPVVCTPSGGAQSVRVMLPRGWDESMSDEALLGAIAGAR